jgi:hypothetical protein
MEQERVLMKRHLAEAEKAVAHGNSELARQQKIVAQLEHDGQDSAVARKVFAEFKALQELRVADRDWLIHALANRPR